MTWENEIREFVGRPTRESELERHSIMNTPGNSSQNPVNLETPTIQHENPTLSENPTPSENPAQNPAQSPLENPTKNPVPVGNPAPLLFTEIRKLRKPGKGV
jgi:hypothetical protein